MPRPDVDQLDEQIERLRGGGTLTENEVKVLCDKVSEADREYCSRIVNGVCCFDVDVFMLAAELS
jgi:hypothetical protein